MWRATRRKARLILHELSPPTLDPRVKREGDIVALIPMSPHFRLMRRKGMGRAAGGAMTALFPAHRPTRRRNPTRPAQFSPSRMNTS